VRIFFFGNWRQKLGHPVPESNFGVGTEECVVAADAAVESLVVQVVVLPVKARSVPCWRVTSNCSGVSSFPLGVGLVDLGT